MINFAKNEHERIRNLQWFHQNDWFCIRNFFNKQKNFCLLVKSNIICNRLNIQIDLAYICFYNDDSVLIIRAPVS